MVDIGEKSITIVNKNPSTMLESHIKYLKESRENSSTQDMFNLIEKRVKNLSSGKIVISIGEDLLYKEKRTIEIFDKILRETKSLIRSGVVYKKDLSEKSSYLKHLMIEDYPYSTISLIIALKNALSSYNSLQSVHGVIYEDKKDI